MINNKQRSEFELKKTNTKQILSIKKVEKKISIWKEQMKSSMFIVYISDCSRNSLKICSKSCLILNKKRFKSNLTRIEELSTGAAYCQLTDLLFRGSITLKKVKWNTRNDIDCLHNWRLLQFAWKDLGINKVIPVERLIRSRFQDNFEFLQWFKKFFDANYRRSPYDALAARNWQVMLFARTIQMLIHIADSIH
uniref:Calponin-homology (CH) domain-containing protein n=1 Tax=Syphacia muris TaxID=451379 RepID=A0A0N5ALR1_9BILA